MKIRGFYLALAAYAILALLAAFTLDGAFRAATLILLGGLALKTCLFELRSKLE